MKIFKTVKEIQSYLVIQNADSIGFVPTMGALHKGHLSLINQSKNENNLTVCSIFVNPKQFNKQEDLEKYPRNIEADLEKLNLVKCDVVFIPSVEEMYPSTQQDYQFNFGVLSEVMEAEHRPGHFNGVAIVIQRFFEILNPTKAYFGEKDYQQLAVVKELVKQVNSSVEIIGCPIFREESGLAMSSRNERLDKNQLISAAQINKGLSYVVSHKHTHTIEQLKQYFINHIAASADLQLEYFEIVDKSNLQPIKSWEEAKDVIAFTAVIINGVRLIDNMTIIN